MILGILLGIGLFGGFIIGVPFFIAWVAHEHIQASKYRRLLVLASQYKSITGWTVTYRDKGKPKTITVPGDTETEMIRNLAKQGITFEKIISSVKQ